MSSLPFSFIEANESWCPCVLYINVIVCVAYVTFDVSRINFTRITTLAADFRILLILFTYWMRHRLWYVNTQQITWTNVWKNIDHFKIKLDDKNVSQLRCWVDQWCSLTRLVLGLKRTSLPSLLRKWKNYLFSSPEKLTFSEIFFRNIRAKKTWKRTFSWLIFPFLVNHMVKDNISSFSNFADNFPKKC